MLCYSGLIDYVQIMNVIPVCHHQTCKKLVKAVFAEHKKTRVAGEPRDFVDCYLDELDKVCWGRRGAVNLLHKTESQFYHHPL